MTWVETIEQQITRIIKVRTQVQGTVPESVAISEKLYNIYVREGGSNPVVLNAVHTDLLTDLEYRLHESWGGFFTSHIDPPRGTLLRDKETGVEGAFTGEVFTSSPCWYGIPGGKIRATRTELV